MLVFIFRFQIFPEPLLSGVFQSIEKIAKVGLSFYLKPSKIQISETSGLLAAGEEFN
jgi:hypothetical protein